MDTDKPGLLLVDDEERIVRSLKMLFRSNYRVMATTDVNQALVLARTEKVHVVISDQRMPEMLGMELLEKIREISPSTMRLLLTGYSDVDAIIGAVNSGEIFRYITKPWKSEDLIRTVEEAARIAMETDNLDEPGVAVEDTSKPNILVVDRDVQSYEMVQDLAGDGAQVLYRNNLDDALDVLAETQISVLVADIRLGDEDITDALNAIKQENPHLVTIVMTSFKDTNVLIRLINHGQVYRFLPKPPRRGLLGQALTASLKRYQAYARQPKLVRRQLAESIPSIGNGFASRLGNYLRRIRDRQKLGA